MKVFIGIPCDKGWLLSETAISYAANLLYLRDRGVEVNGSVVNYESAFNARAVIVEDARNWGADFIGMMDDDMVVNPEIFWKLLCRDLDVIIPLTTSRQAPYESVVYDLKEWDDPSKRTTKKFFPKTTLRRGLNECDGLGTGVVLFKTSIFSKILRPWFWAIPPYEYEEGKLTQAKGEDLFFCSKARERGIKLYYDGDIEVGHVGNRIIATPGLAQKLGTFNIEETVNA